MDDTRPKDGPFFGRKMKHRYRSDSLYASEYHVPIMVDEVIKALNPKSEKGEGRRFVDGTLGGGGHSEAILSSIPGCKLLSIDRDTDAIAFASKRLAPFDERLQIVLGNYENMVDIVNQHTFSPVDGILVDAGVSSHQLDDAERGFSFRNPGPLDMRMGDDATSLESFLESTDLPALKKVLKDGEVDRAFFTARAILDAFGRGEIKTTTDLAEAVLSVNRRPKKIHPATLVFQALRIELNDELNGLRRFVESAPDLLKVGGRIAVMSFHSLEDRIVKRTFAKLSKDNTPKGIPIRVVDLNIWGQTISRKPIMANVEEVENNPRSRSAKLRVLQRASEESCITLFEKP